jgi:plastocyanin
MSFRLMVNAVAMLFGAASLVAAAQSGTVSGKVTAKGLRTSANIVVSLEAPGLEVNPPSTPVELDQKQMEFIPHVLAVVTGTTVRFLNSDTVAHNVFSPDGKYNLGTWPMGQSKDHVFDKPGVYTQLCQVHPEMEGYVVVLDTLYFATTDRSGAFEIENVPAGNYKLVAWSEKLKRAEQEVTVEAGKATTVDVTMSR